MKPQPMKDYASFAEWKRDQSPENLRRINAIVRLVKQVAPEFTQTVKWGQGCFTHGDAHKAFIHAAADHVQFGFYVGSALHDPQRVLVGNGKHVRHVKVYATKDIPREALAALLQQVREPKKAPKTSSVVLLSGGNPQIAKGEGDAVVQAYLAAMPGWKADIGRRLDAIITKTVRGVHKAVKWNSPFYGIKGEGWFVSFHCFNKYVKVTFFQGASLRPAPVGKSKYESVRYHDIYEGQLDDAQFAKWVKQASRLPGEKL